MQDRVLIFDNGADSIKFGFSNQSEPDEMINCTANIARQMQTLVGDQMKEIHNTSTLQLSRPFDRGYITNWACEIEIWKHLFSNRLKVASNDVSLIVTEPPLAPVSLQNDMNEVVFEEFNVRSYMRRPAAWFSAYEFANNPLYRSESENNSPRSCCMVVDSGFSFTHCYPFVDLNCRQHAIKRINVGGKLMTNYLKEIVSYRQWNLMDDFALINSVKEQTCFVQQDDIFTSLKNNVTDPNNKYFVLPDFQTVVKGYVLPEGENPQSGQKQCVAMGIERFSVPELLFHPSDIGLGQAGVAESCWQSVQSLPNDTPDTFIHQSGGLPVDEQILCASNVVLTGGSVQFPGFKERFEREWRSYIPDLIDTQVYLPLNPSHFAWQGAARFAQTELLSTIQSNNQSSPRKKTKISSSTDSGVHKYFVSRKEYLENGHDYCNRKFSDW